MYVIYVVLFYVYFLMQNKLQSKETQHCLFGPTASHLVRTHLKFFFLASVPPVSFFIGISGIHVLFFCFVNKHDFYLDSCIRESLLWSTGHFNGG